MTYSVRFAETDAAVIMRTLPPAIKRRIKAALRKLAQDPSGTTIGLDVKRLRTAGHPPAFRLRVGDWRVVWLLRPASIDVIRIFHRREGYGWLERRYP